MVCQFDINDQCFENCPHCSRCRYGTCSVCGAQFLYDELEDNMCEDCYEESLTPYCENCNKVISIEEDEEYNGYCKNCHNSKEE
jgi:hypothetical protein